MNYEAQRLDMVAKQVEAHGITDKRVLDAMRKVPRHLFVSEALRDQAYKDFPLPIGEGQTISQPYMVAVMTQALELGPKDRVLEIGTGSGYQAAILSRLAFRVFTIERVQSLFMRARRLFDEMHYHNIRARCSDGTLGWEEEAPFDAIIVTAGAPVVGQVLANQLTVGGRLIVPVGDQNVQNLIKVVRSKDGVQTQDLGGCRFVKLIGAQGWKE